MSEPDEPQPPEAPLSAPPPRRGLFDVTSPAAGAPTPPPLAPPPVAPDPSPDRNRRFERDGDAADEISALPPTGAPESGGAWSPSAPAAGGPTFAPPSEVTAPTVAPEHLPAEPPAVPPVTAAAPTPPITSVPPTPEPSPTSARPDEETAGAEDWTDQVTGLLVDTVDRVHDKVTGPILNVVTMVSFGSAAAVVLAITVILLVVVGMRLLALIPIPLWSAYAALGAVLLLSGMLLWSKRLPRVTAPPRSRR